MALRRSDFLKGLGLGWLGLVLAPFKARAAPRVVPKPKQVWEAVEFDFEKNGETFPGYALRLPDASGAPGDVLSVCRLCPHERCTFGFETNFEAVGRMTGAQIANPVFFCRCHMSVFDPSKQAAVVSGPAPRGAWRFTHEDKGTQLLITSLEDGAGTIK